MKLQSMCENIGKWGCLAIDYAYVALALSNDISKMEQIEIDVALFQLLELADVNNYLDKECYVKDGESLMNYFTGKKCKVTKQNITSFKDLPLDKYSAVRFDYNGKSHFVVAKGQIVVYDSLDDSQCRKYGKPTTARIVEIIE